MIYVIVHNTGHSSLEIEKQNKTKKCLSHVTPSENDPNCHFVFSVWMLDLGPQFFQGLERSVWRTSTAIITVNQN